MPRAYDDDDEDFDDYDADDGDDTVACPHCGASIYADAEWCPRCENYLSREEVTSSTPVWVKATAAFLLLFVLLFWLT